VHQGIYRAVYDPDTGMVSLQTIITTVGTHGTQSTVVDGASPADGGLTIAPDGTLYQVTGGEFGADTIVTKITPTGISSTTIPGVATGRVVIAPDGTAYVSTYYLDPTQASVVSMVHAIGTTATPVGAVNGSPILDGLVVGADGTVYQTTYSMDPMSPTTTRTTVTIIRPGTTSTAVMDGLPLSGVVVGIDGTAYQTTVDQQANTTLITTISPSGVVTTSTTPGTPVGRSVVVAPNGIAYQVVSSVTPNPDNPGAFQYSATVIQINASQATAITYPGAIAVGPVVIGSDGRAYLVTTEISYDPADPASAALRTVVTALGGDGPSTVAAVDGAAAANLVVTADGLGWLLTRTGESGAYDDRAWLVTLTAVAPPTDTRPPSIRQLERFVRNVVSVPASIARAAAEATVRSVAVTIEMATRAAAAAVRAMQEVNRLMGQVAEALRWAALGAASYIDAVAAEIARLLGIPGTAGTRLVARALPLVGIGFAAGDLADGIDRMLSGGKPVTGFLNVASGLVGIVGGAVLLAGPAAPIGLGMLAISAGLSGAAILLETFAPEFDANVNQFFGDAGRTVTQVTDDFLDTAATTLDNVAHWAQDLYNGAGDFVASLLPPLRLLG
jgi:hypothetical protein